MWLCRCFMMGGGELERGSGGHRWLITWRAFHRFSWRDKCWKKSSKGKHSFWTASSHTVLAHLPYLVKCWINAALNCSILWLSPIKMGTRRLEILPRFLYAHLWYSDSSLDIFSMFLLIYCEFSLKLFGHLVQQQFIIW